MTVADAFDRMLATHRAPLQRGPAHATPLERLRLLAIDSETTGLRPTRDRLVALAAFEIDGLEIAPHPALDTLLAPGIPIPESARRIHGIDERDVEGAPRFVDIFLRWRQVTDGRILVGHHLGFDLAVIASEARRYGIPWRTPPFVDTAVAIASLEPGQRHLDLADILRRHGIEPQGRRHSAAADARMAAELYVAVARRLIGRGEDSWGRLADFSRGSR